MLILVGLVSEICQLLVFFISMFLVAWINSDRDKVEGALLCIAFIVNGFLTIWTRSIYQFNSNKLSININRGISTLLYTKLTRLSQKGLAMTTSGKLVSLVSGELQVLEKSMWFIPHLVIAPIANIL